MGCIFSKFTVDELQPRGASSVLTTRTPTQTPDSGGGNGGGPCRHTPSSGDGSNGGSGDHHGRINGGVGRRCHGAGDAEVVLGMGAGVVSRAAPNNIVAEAA
ncbi:unnamed protein product [Calypogeia fissa]